MNRIANHRLLALLLAAAVVLVGTAGCALRERATADVTDLAWDAQALQTLGFAPADLAADDSPHARADGPGARHPRLRYLFRNALHGEATVRTEDGLRTVVAPRGTVTEVTGATLTVSSEDGFTLTWNLAGQTIVVVDRSRSEIAAVPVGTEVGVAGSREGETMTARLVVVPRR